MACCCKINEKSLHRVIAIVTIVVAVIVSLTVGVWRHPENLFYVFLMRVFGVMIPILVVGALVKYLFSGIGEHKNQ